MPCVVSGYRAVVAKKRERHRIHHLAPRREALGRYDTAEGFAPYKHASWFTNTHAQMNIRVPLKTQCEAHKPP